MKSHAGTEYAKYLIGLQKLSINLSLILARG